MQSRINCCGQVVVFVGAAVDGVHIYITFADNMIIRKIRKSQVVHRCKRTLQYNRHCIFLVVLLYKLVDGH